jgi:hypothetical protein
MLLKVRGRVNLSSFSHQFYDISTRAFENVIEPTSKRRKGCSLFLFLLPQTCQQFHSIPGNPRASFAITPLCLVSM